MDEQRDQTDMRNATSYTVFAYNTLCGKN